MDAFLQETGSQKQTQQKPLAAICSVFQAFSHWNETIHRTREHVGILSNFTTSCWSNINTQQSFWLKNLQNLTLLWTVQVRATRKDHHPANFTKKQTLIRPLNPNQTRRGPMKLNKNQPLIEQWTNFCTR